MQFPSRLKRATKELLALHQWPRSEPPRPKTYEEQIYASLVQLGDTCLDVGANVGDVAIFIARLCGDSGRVIAFEPVAPVYLELVRNIQQNCYMKAPIVPYPAGLSNAQINATIQVPGNRFGLGSMASIDSVSRLLPGTTVKSFEARFFTWDALVASQEIPNVDFVKIDVEGAELLVLNGGRGVLESGQRPVMLIEIFAPWEDNFGYRPWDVFSFLMAFDYEFLFACPEGLIPHVPSLENAFPPEYLWGYNVIAFVRSVHAKRIVRLSTLYANSSPHLLSMEPPPKPNAIE